MSEERHPVRDHGQVQAEVDQHRADLDTARKIVNHAARAVKKHAADHKEAHSAAANRIGALLSEMKPHEWKAALAQAPPEEDTES